MSIELVGVVTREAQLHADQIGFASVADHERLKRSALVAAPALALLVVPLLLWPALSMVLLGRLFLADLTIARRVTVENITQKVWPTGETLIQVKAAGSVDHEKGKLVVNNGLVSDTYDLESKDRDPATGQAIYFAEVKQYSNDFTFNTYIGDGRLPENGLVSSSPGPSSRTFLPGPNCLTTAIRGPNAGPIWSSRLAAKFRDCRVRSSASRPNFPGSSRKSRSSSMARQRATLASQPTSCLGN